MLHSIADDSGSKPKAKMPDRSHVVIDSTYIAAASTVGAGLDLGHGWAIHVWVGAVSLVAGIVSYHHGQPSTRLSSVQHLLASLLVGVATFFGGAAMGVGNELLIVATAIFALGAASVIETLSIIRRRLLSKVFVSLGWADPEDFQPAPPNRRRRDD